MLSCLRVSAADDKASLEATLFIATKPIDLHFSACFESGVDAHSA